MSIAGIWHGPAWTFVVFGILHGLGLAANQAWKKRKLKMPDSLAWLVNIRLRELHVCLFPLAGPHDSAALRARNGAARKSAGLRCAPERDSADRDAGRPAGGHRCPARLLRKKFAGIRKTVRADNRQAIVSAALVLLGLLYMNSSPAKQFVYFVF